MLKSKLIDTKYVDPKGVVRTPNVITSITEDEIKEGKFSPEDILPATAVQVALSNAQPGQFPIPYKITNNDVVFNVPESNLDSVILQLGYTKKFSVGSVLYLTASWCEFDGSGLTVMTGCNYDHVNVDFKNISIEDAYNYSDISKALYLSYDDITLRDKGKSAECEITPSTIGLGSPSSKTYVSESDFKTLKRVANNSYNSIPDVDTGATLSDLISSYNSLLAHLRTSGILQA